MNRFVARTLRSRMKHGAKFFHCCVSDQKKAQPKQVRQCFFCLSEDEKELRWKTVEPLDSSAAGIVKTEDIERVLSTPPDIVKVVVKELMRSREKSKAEKDERGFAKQMFSVKVAGAVHHFYSPSKEDVVFWSEAFRTITSQRYQDHEFIDDIRLLIEADVMVRMLDLKHLTRIPTPRVPTVVPPPPKDTAHRMSRVDFF